MSNTLGEGSAVPFLKLDLDAKKRVPRAAKAAGITEAELGWGLMDLWEHVWQSKKPVVSELVLYGFFPGQRTVEALVAFEFLEAVGDDFRVRGADSYLRVSEARAKGGHAAKTNLVPGGGKKASAERLAEREPSVSREAAEQPSRLPLGSYTQHPDTQTPRVLKESTTRAESLVPVAVTPPDTSPDTWLADDFWRWAQSRRQAAGLVAERMPPRDLGSWWSACLMTPGITCQRLKAAFEAFGQDPYWERSKPPFPFSGFKSQWDKFIGEKHAIAS